MVLKGYWMMMVMDTIEEELLATQPSTQLRKLRKLLFTCQRCKQLQQLLPVLYHITIIHLPSSSNILPMPHYHHHIISYHFIIISSSCHQSPHWQSQYHIPPTSTTPITYIQTNTIMADISSHHCIDLDTKYCFV